jgi:hypothetical protein
MNLDGSGFRQLTNDGTFKFLPHFSPDASRIAYTKYLVGQYGSPNAVTDIAVFDLRSNTQTVITHQGNDVQATWAPRGKRLAYLNTVQPTTIWTIDPDVANPQPIARSSGAIDDLQWGDIAWSSDDSILFSVAQNVNGCFKARTEKIRPDGSSRTQVSDGGPNCAPPGLNRAATPIPAGARTANHLHLSCPAGERSAWFDGTQALRFLERCLVLWQTGNGARLLR